MGAPPCGVVWKRIRFGIRLTPLEKSEVEVDNVGAPPCWCCLETNSVVRNSANAPRKFRRGFKCARLKRVQW